MTIFLISMLYVGLKSFQQKNVQHDAVWFIPPTSYLMAVMEVTVILSVVREGTIWAAIPLGTGSWVGCLLAMAIHKRIRSR